MTYMPGSGTGYFYLLSKRLVDRFQYANAAGVTFKDGSFYPTEFRYSLTRLKAAVIPNLDAHLPVALALVGDGEQGLDVRGLVHGSRLCGGS